MDDQPSSHAAAIVVPEAPEQPANLARGTPRTRARRGRELVQGARHLHVKLGKDILDEAAGGRLEPRRVHRSRRCLLHDLKNLNASIGRRFLAIVDQPGLVDGQFGCLVEMLEEQVDDEMGSPFIVYFYRHVPVPPVVNSA